MHHHKNAITSSVLKQNTIASSSVMCFIALYVSLSLKPCTEHRKKFLNSSNKLMVWNAESKIKFAVNLQCHSLLFIFLSYGGIKCLNTCSITDSTSSQ